MGVFIYVGTLYVPWNMSNQIRVQQHPTGQLTVTIPRALAQALGIRKGDVMEWTLEDGKLLLIRARK